MKTDTQIQQDVMAELKWENSVQATQIGVEVSKGVVTLAGHVSTYAEKWNAERAALRVSGVNAMTIEIEVNQGGLSTRTDADIAGSVSNVLMWTTYLPKDSVKVMVEDGWVTLSGEVDWEYQRRSAGAAVRYLLDVKGVTNNIFLKPNVSLITVKFDIEAALKRRAKKDAKRISVAVDGNEVTLTGTVDSWAERELANHAAWGSAGVRKVIDNMTINY